MSIPKDPDPAKLVISFFMKEKEIFSKVFSLIEEVAGTVDIISPWFDFDYTDYYHKEMGHPLFRRVVAYKRLLEQDQLSVIKQKTNNIENQFIHNDKRHINIDPGILLSSRFILATGKDFSHRIYIGNQIYADLTLIYRNLKFHKLDWTYPDYASDEMTAFLIKVRNKYVFDLKERKNR